LRGASRASVEQWRASCGFASEYVVYAEDAGLDASVIEQLHGFEPWELDNDLVKSIVQQLAEKADRREWIHVQLCAMILLTSDLHEVIEEIYAQRLGGLCLYICEIENDDVQGLVAKKLARAAWLRIYDHLLSCVEHVKV